MPPDAYHDAQRVRSLIREVSDFPKPGVQFRDITPLLADPAGFAEAIDLLAQAVLPWAPEALVAIESRGFLLGAVLAQRIERPLHIVRKPGKLPWKTAQIDYALEYGRDSLQIHVDAVTPGRRYAVVDDVLATGGTAEAAAQLVESLGGTVAGCAFLIELAALGGRARLGARPVSAVLTY